MAVPRPTPIPVPQANTGFDPDAYLKEVTAESAAPVAAAAVGGFDPDAYVGDTNKQFVEDDEFDPYGFAVENPDKLEWAKEIAWQKEQRPMTAKRAANLGKIVVTSIPGLVKDVGEGLGNVAADAYIQATDETPANVERAKTQQLARAQIIEGHTGSLFDKFLGPDSRFGKIFYPKQKDLVEMRAANERGGWEKYAPNHPDKDKAVADIEKKKEEAVAALPPPELPRQEFDRKFEEKLHHIQRERELLKGNPQSDGLIATGLKAMGDTVRELVSGEQPHDNEMDVTNTFKNGAQLEEMGAPVDAEAIRTGSVAADPMMLAPLHLPRVFPIANRVAGAALKAPAAITRKIVENTPEVLSAAAKKKLLGAGATAAGGAVAYEALNNPAAAAKHLAAAGILTAGVAGARYFGRVMDTAGSKLLNPKLISAAEREGAEAAMNIEKAGGGQLSTFGKKLVNPKMNKADLERALVRPMQGAATAPLVMAPFTAAVSESPEEAAAMTGGVIGFGAFGGATSYNPLKGFHPETVAAVDSILRDNGARKKYGTELDAKHDAWMANAPEGVRDGVNSYRGFFDGFKLSNGREPQIYVLPSAEFGAEVSKRRPDVKPDHAAKQRGFIGKDGSILINGDYGGEAPGILGHEAGGHAAMNIMATIAPEIVKSMDAAAKKGLTDGKGNPTKEMRRFVDAYNKEFDPTGKKIGIKNESQAIEEWLAEQGRAVLEGEGPAKFAAGNSVRQKIADNLADHFHKVFGTERMFDRKEVPALARQYRDLLYDLGRLRGQEGPATAPEPAPGEPAAAPAPDPAAPAGARPAAEPVAPSRPAGPDRATVAAELVKMFSLDPAEAEALAAKATGSTVEEMVASQAMDAFYLMEQPAAPAAQPASPAGPSAQAAGVAAVAEPAAAPAGQLAGFGEPAPAKPKMRVTKLPDGRFEYRDESGNLIPTDASGQPVRPGAAPEAPDASRGGAAEPIELPGRPVDATADLQARLEAAEQAARAAESTKKRRTPESREKATTQAVKEARIQALLDAAHEAAPDESHLQRREEFGTVKFTGRIDESIPAHRMLLDELGVSEGGRSNIDTLSANLGKPVFIRYKSAAKEGSSEAAQASGQVDRTGKQRSKEYKAESVGARIEDAQAGDVNTGVEQTKSFYPLGFRVNPSTGSVTVTGFSPQRLLLNVGKIVEFMRGKGRETGYTGADDPAINDDMQGYAQNHANSYKGDGSGPIAGETPTPNYEPYIIDGTRFDVLNAAMGNESAKTPKSDREGAKARAGDLQDFAAANETLLTEGGETNALRQWLNESGFEFRNEGGEVRTGTKEVLEPTIESLRVDPELMRSISTEAPGSEASLRPTGGVADPSAMTAAGIPKARNVAAGFMPGKGEGQLGEFGREKDKPSIESKVRDEQLELFKGVDFRGTKQKFDDDYLNAVKSDDLDAANAAVREAAQKAGYEIGPVFHGSTVEKLNVIDPNAAIETSGVVFLSDNADVSQIFRFPREYGEVVTSYYNERTGEDVDIEPGAMIGAYVKMRNPLVIEGAEAQKVSDDSAYQAQVMKKAKADGHDGVILEDVYEGVGDWTEGGTTYAVFDASQIKSADSVTRDDNGQIIPPSRRFDVASDDIRFMPGQGKQLEGFDRKPKADELGFYSRLRQHVEEADFGRSKPKAAGHWLGVIEKWAKGASTPTLGVQSRGIARDELEWSGVKEWLKSQGSKPIKKADVLAFIDGNGVKVSEVQKGGGEGGGDKYWMDDEVQDLTHAFEDDHNGAWEINAWPNEEGGESKSLVAIFQPKNEKAYKIKNEGGEFVLYSGDGRNYSEEIGSFKTRQEAEDALNEEREAEDSADPVFEIHDSSRGSSYQVDTAKTFEEAVRKARELASKRLRELNEEASGEDAGDTQFSGYKLSGGTNYKEVLLTLPADGNENTALADWKRQAEAKYGEEWTPDDLTPHERKRLTELEAVSGKPLENFHDSHWSEPNVVAHFRQQDFDGQIQIGTGKDKVLTSEKVRHIDEFQSDWHQKGRERGYRSEAGEPIDTTGWKAEKKPRNTLPWQPPAAPEDFYWEIQDAAGTRISGIGRDQAATPEEAVKRVGILHAEQAKQQAIPDAPFKKTWSQLAFKRALKLAVEDGMERMSWSTGEQNAGHYGLEKHVDGIRWEPLIAQVGEGRMVRVDTKEGRTINLQVGKDGKVSSSQGGAQFEGKYLSDVLGKEVSDKVLGEKDSGFLKGLDLKVGGEGMRTFYDEMIPQFANKYVSKWGSKVEDIVLPNGETVHSVEITPEMKAAVERGQPMFMPGSRGAEQAAGGKRQLEDFGPVNSLGFYSGLRQTVDKKIPNRASVDQVKRALDPANGGVKKEELEALGLPQFLEGKTHVTKQELLEFVDTHGVDLKEVEKGSGFTEEQKESFEAAVDERAQELFDKRVQDIEAEMLDNGHDEDSIDRYDIGGQLDWNDFVMAAHEEISARDNIGEDGDQTLFSQYKLDGGENYKELNYVLPDRAQEAPAKVEEIPEGWQVAITRDDGSVTRVTVRHDRASNAEEAERYARGYAGKSAKNGSANYTVPRSHQYGDQSDTNRLYHTRQADHVDTEGNRVRMVEEWQSDWHQTGREQGYRDGSGRSPAEIREELRVLSEQYDNAYKGVTTREFEAYNDQVDNPEATDPRFIAANAVRAELSPKIDALRKELYEAKNSPKVPDAPFKKSWHELAFKKSLGDAVRDGMDKLAWTTGEQQAERYDLSKQLDSVRSYKNADGTYSIQGMKDGQVLVAKSDLDAAGLAANIGKELAQKIVAGEGEDIGTESSKRLGREDREFSGIDLKVGGEGMQGFYDNIMVKFANKYLKPWGVKVETTNIVTRDPENKSDGLSFDRWHKETYGSEFGAMTPDQDARIAAYKKYIDEYASTPQTETVHSITITPEMREAVGKGQPMFMPGKGADKPASSDLSGFGKDESSIESKVEWAQPKRAKSAGDVVVNVKTSAFDEAYQKDHGFYIDKDGSGEIKGRRERFKEFLKEGKPVEMPEVVITKEGTAAFVNGRHRFSVMRDAGVESIPMSMDETSALRAKTLGMTVEGEAAKGDLGSFMPGDETGRGEFEVKEKKPVDERRARLMADMQGQAKWLGERAKEKGFDSVEDLMTEDFDGYNDLAKQWRDEHPRFDEAGNQLFMPGTGEPIEPVESAGADPKDKKAARKAWLSQGVKSPWFKNWFGKSKVVGEDGEPLKVFSGHAQVELYGDAYDPKKSTAGAFYATEDAAIASNYALGKLGVKEEFTEGSQYRLKQKNGKFGKKLWQVELTPEQQQKVREFLGNEEGRGVDLERYWKEHAPFDADARRAQYQGLRSLVNIYKALESLGYTIAYPREAKDLPSGEREPLFMTQEKNDFEELLDHIGIEWSSFDYAQPGVQQLYLKIENPLDASAPFPADLMTALEKAAKRDRSPQRDLQYAQWTSDYPLKQWVEDIKSGDEYWTTHIPKKALPIIKSFGYDGIKELGMKGAKNREERQINWLAFDAGQIKSAIGNQGTFDETKPSMLAMPGDGSGLKRTWFMRDGKRVYHTRGEAGKFTQKPTLAKFPASAISSGKDDEDAKAQLETFK